MQKHSHKREAILTVLRSTKSHPSAEWVYQQVKQTIPGVSLATVYRNLALFRKQGKLISIATVNGQERYDANTIPHTHFICTDCGAVLDVDDVSANADIGSLEQRHGFQISSQFLTLYGVCEDCLKAEEPQFG